MATTPEGYDWSASLVFPIVVWVTQQVATAGVTAFRWLKRQDFLYNNILEEIRRTRASNEEFAAVLRQARTTGILEARMAADPAYFVFVILGNPSPSVFRSDSSEFSALGRNTSRDVIAFFETQSMISATLDSLRSEDFRLLDNARKMQAVDQLIGLFTKSQELGLNCEPKLAEAVRTTPYRRYRRLLARVRAKLRVRRRIAQG